MSDELELKTVVALHWLCSAAKGDGELLGRWWRPVRWGAALGQSYTYTRLLFGISEFHKNFVQKIVNRPRVFKCPNEAYISLVNKRHY